MIINYLIIHTICAFIFIWYGNKVIDWDGWDRGGLALAGIIGGPIMFLILIALHPPTIKISNLFKPKRKVLPHTYNGYYWGEVVLIDGDQQGIVIGSDTGSLYIIKVNEATRDWYDLNRITSTQGPSELAQELELYKQSKELEDKATALINESKAISEKAMKLRKTVLVK